MRNKKRFTLIELLVVIAIIGILASMLLPSLQEALFHARVGKCISNHKALVLGVTAYALDNEGYYPDGGLARHSTYTLADNSETMEATALARYFGYEHSYSGNWGLAAYGEELFTCPQSPSKGNTDSNKQYQYLWNQAKFAGSWVGTSTDAEAEASYCKAGHVLGDHWPHGYRNKGLRMTRYGQRWTFKEIWYGPSKNQSPKYDLLTGCYSNFRDARNHIKANDTYVVPYSHTDGSVEAWISEFVWTNDMPLLEMNTSSAQGSGTWSNPEYPDEYQVGP